MHRNSLDFLRLAAATMVLYSHQYALLGLQEPPACGGWCAGGSSGVAIFFFLSGFLVWSSWDRDPHARRFFLRRSLRIFPALWAVCLLSVFVLGPLASVLPVGEYFASPATWLYLGTGVLVSSKTLPGIFADNTFAYIVNGSLWTLPLEFLCYLTVAAAGLACASLARYRTIVLSLCLLGFVLLASFAPLWVGARFAPHFEMAALFWWGVLYGACIKYPTQHRGWTLLIMAISVLLFSVLGAHGLQRTVTLACIAALVHAASRTPWGARLTDRVGDMSYGVYIMAFPVQQMAVQWGRGQGWSLGTYFAISLSVTFGLAYLCWHGVEKPTLRFKPTAEGAV